MYTGAGKTTYVSLDVHDFRRFSPPFRIINLITGKVRKTSPSSASIIHLTILPEGGIIRVNGELVESLASWKSRIAFVPQEDVKS